MKHTYPLAFLLSAALIFGCKDSSTNTSGSSGDIVGYVQVYDTLYNQPISDNSGVKVTVPGTSYTAISDRSGKWRLSNVPPGVYKIFFSKDGYSSMEIFNVAFEGNGTYYYSLDKGKVSVYQLPNIFPNIVIRPFEDDIRIHDTTAMDSLGYLYYITDTIIIKNNIAIFSSRSQFHYGQFEVMSRIYFGKTKILDPLDTKTFLYASNFQYNSDGVDTTEIANITLYRTDFIKAGFSSGDSIYCAAFASPVNLLQNASWYDPETDSTMYSGFSPHHSEVVSFALP